MLELSLILMPCGILLGVFIGYWIIYGYPKSQANALRQKFVNLGTLQGKTRAQIEAVAGKPSSWASLIGNKSTYTWSTSRYHITLRFNGDICEGVTSEISV